MRANYTLASVAAVTSVLMYSKVLLASEPPQESSHYSNPTLSAKLNSLLGPNVHFELAEFNDAFERVKLDNQIFLASKNGQYLFFGKVIDTSKQIDLVELANQQHRKKLIESIAREKLLSYKAKNEQHTLTIFTDIDCPFCRKLHSQIKTLNQQGVTVDYIMLPRGKAGSMAFDKTANALCADIPQAAMDTAMQSGQFKQRTQATAMCVKNLKTQQLLAQTFGFSATPTILFANGEIVPGFMKTEDILKKLNTL